MEMQSRVGWSAVVGSMIEGLKTEGKANQPEDDTTLISKSSNHVEVKSRANEAARAVESTLRVQTSPPAATIPSSSPLSPLF